MTDSPEKILLILIAGIGDVVLATKSFRAIRNGYPDSEIHLLTSSEGSVVCRHNPRLNRVRSFPIRELRRNGWRATVPILKLVASLRRESFDMVVQLYQVGSRVGALRMGLLLSAINGKTRVGHDRYGLGAFLDKKVPGEIFNEMHLADAMTEIARLAGGTADEDGTEIWWRPESGETWGKALRGNSGEILIGINPGGDRENRRWNPESYAVLADSLIERYRAGIVVFGGPGEEGLAAAVMGKMRHPALNLAGKLTLDDLAFVISRLDLMVTNDSGPMHLAAATKTPVVAIFGPEDPAFTRPYADASLYRLVYKNIACRPCRKETCRDIRCLDLIAPDEVLAKCGELLGKG